MDQDKRASEISKSIGEILLNDWDPIGVRQVPEAQDEYDGYVAGVYRLLASGASEQAICEHLSQIEEKSMGLGTRNPQSLQEIARKLISLNVRL